jgi:hypothetical protein
MVDSNDETIDSNCGRLQDPVLLYKIPMGTRPQRGSPALAKDLSEAASQKKMHL